MPAAPLRIVLAQIDLLVGDIPGNAERLAQAAATARDDMAADLVLFPELSLTGYPPEDLLLRPSLDLRAHQRPAEVFAGADLHARWPGLAADAEHGLHLPGLAHVRNPRLLKVLTAALRRQPGVSLREQSEVEAVTPANGAGGQAGVRLAGGEQITANAVVVCGGAWTAKLLPGAALPVRPIRGQMQLYHLPPGSVPAMILRDGHYIIQRRDGHVLCGSTMEDAGFDKSTTDVARDKLSAAAARLWPALAGAPLLRQWAGLRPWSPNGIPFIGPVPGQAGVWVNAGQFRNGLVLAPASARLLADLLLGRAPEVDPAPYLPAG